MPQINALAASAGLTAAPSQGKQDLGEQEFLNLLMTQLGNQDPLSPMQSADFAQQVASMNQVKQLMGANRRLDQLMLGMTSMNNQSAVQLVGKEVIARGDTFTHESGQSHDLQFELPEKADRVTVTVRDAEGRVVRIMDSFDRDAGLQSIAWSGMNDSTQDVPGGTLTFDVTAEDADGNAIEVDTYIRGTVDELRFDKGFPMLLIGGAEVGMDQILRVLDVGEPSPTAEPPAPAVPQPPSNTPSSAVLTDALSGPLPSF